MRLASHGAEAANGSREMQEALAARIHLRQGNCSFEGETPQASNSSSAWEAVRARLEGHQEEDLLRLGRHPWRVQYRPGAREEKVAKVDDELEECKFAATSRRRHEEFGVVESFEKVSTELE